MMRRARVWRGAFLLVFLPLLALAAPARGQQAAAHAGYAYPAGGRQGTSFQVMVGGQNLEGTTDALFSGAGVKATVTDYFKQLNPGQYMFLRDQVKLLLDKKEAASGTGRAATQPAAAKPVWTAADEAKLADLRKRLSKPPKRVDNPAIAETVTLQVTIDAQAAPGDYEIRLRTLTGLTNPIVFRVGQVPEYAAKDFKADAVKGPAIALPAVVNGQILPGAVDRFRIQAKKGQSLVILAAARALIPYLSDAVPGWFQAAVTLYDSQGKELAFADHFRFDPDPVIHVEVPADGEYTVEIRDSIYRGREDFVYRITMGELPYITGVYPLGCKTGTQTAAELTGWNLPVKSLAFDARQKAPGVFPISVTKDGVMSNTVPFAVDSLEEVAEEEPNDTAAAAQLLTLPVIVNGRIERPGDVDVFCFAGKAGEEVVAEVTARRLGSPLDSVLVLTDASGKQIALNDDHEDKGMGLETHYADSYLHVTLPAAGVYYLQLADIQHKGGREFAYRLRVSAPRPDFALRVTPSSISVRGGANTPLTLYALRKDDFAGEITIRLKDAPAGFSLSGAKISARQDQVTFTLKAPANGAAAEPVAFTFEGRAMVGGQPVLHEAVPAEDMMQAFAYHHLVASQELLVNVANRPLGRAAARILSAMPVKLAPGASATIRTNMPTEVLLGKIELELSQPAEGMTLQSVSAVAGGSELVVQTDAAKVKAGLKGNIIIKMYLVREVKAEGAKPGAVRRQIPLGSLPAIPFEITAP